MMQDLLIGTGNKGKLGEIVPILWGLPFRLLSLEDVTRGNKPIEKDHDFRENAYIKAVFYAQQTGKMTLAEDSGLFIDALPNQLGVTTRRWGAGEAVSDQEWITYFLDRLKDVPDEERGACFVCHACLVDAPRKVLYRSVGETKEYITRELQAPILPGLPISSCFLPENSSCVYAALPPEEKAAVSHRGKAIHQVRGFLEGYATQRLPF